MAQKYPLITKRSYKSVRTKLEKLIFRRLKYPMNFSGPKNVVKPAASFYQMTDEQINSWFTDAEYTSIDQLGDMLNDGLELCLTSLKQFDPMVIGSIFMLFRLALIEADYSTILVLLGHGGTKFIRNLPMDIMEGPFSNMPPNFNYSTNPFVNEPSSTKLIVMMKKWTDAIQHLLLSATADFLYKLGALLESRTAPDTPAYSSNEMTLNQLPAVSVCDFLNETYTLIQNWFSPLLIKWETKTISASNGTTKVTIDVTHPVVTDPTNFHCTVAKNLIYNYYLQSYDHTQHLNVNNVMQQIAHLAFDNSLNDQDMNQFHLNLVTGTDVGSKVDIGCLFTSRGQWARYFSALTWDPLFVPPYTWLRRLYLILSYLGFSNQYDQYAWTSMESTLGSTALYSALRYDNPANAVFHNFSRGLSLSGIILTGTQILALLSLNSDQKSEDIKHELDSDFDWIDKTDTGNMVWVNNEWDLIDHFGFTVLTKNVINALMKERNDGILFDNDVQHLYSDIPEQFFPDQTDDDNTEKTVPVQQHTPPDTNTSRNNNNNNSNNNPPGVPKRFQTQAELFTAVGSSNQHLLATAPNLFVKRRITYNTDAGPVPAFVNVISSKLIPFGPVPPELKLKSNGFDSKFGNYWKLVREFVLAGYPDVTKNMVHIQWCRATGHEPTSDKSTNK